MKTEYRIVPDSWFMSIKSIGRLFRKYGPDERQMVLLSILGAFIFFMAYWVAVEYNLRALKAAWEARDPVYRAIAGMNWSRPGIWP